MSACGFAYLQLLKNYLLPEQLRTDSDYDAEIQLIGDGVFALFEQQCARQFARTVDATDTCSADRWGCVVSRYPLESVSQVEIRHSAAEGWITLSGQPQDYNPSTGWVELGAIQGSDRSRLRITYTGGYWLAASATDERPVGATAVPGALMLAWLQQCQSVWMRKDKFGEALRSEDPQAAAALLRDELLPTVALTLKHHRRMVLR
jgi:hypothetical protein